MPGKTIAGIVGSTLVAVLVAAPPAGAVTPDTAIANLNAQRSANKLPAGVVHNPALSSGCNHHNGYMLLNNQLTHDEVQGAPGYTAAGAQAGRTSILSRGSPPWVSPKFNPWETAPIHLAQVLDPAMATTGYDESFGFSCMVTLGQPLLPAPAALTIYTYPGPRATIYAGEEAAEGPYTPGQLIGIPAGTTTGPYLFVFLDGPNRAAIDKARIIRAGLRRKKGKKKLKVRRLDGTNPAFGQFVPPGGVLIPLKQLRPGVHVASVTLQTPQGETLKKTWRFRAK